ncbi:FAD:protein FMN transferase [Paenibacillus sinopodophylli]|uniref:FAD:protein FMN transferase n=1 Tax=Paenibacillus sinopodophylli TaxID=1837342 RepID=UPI00110CA31D|nr:FAD:protein FMN transferase [Paenibacillus sinopodophylli]
MSSLVTVKFRAMNTDVEAQLIHGLSEQKGAEYTALVQDWFRDMELRLSRFLSNSEVSQLNRSSGSWMLVSDVMYQLLTEAETYRLHSEGLFTINVLAALQAAGYDRSFDHVSQFQENQDAQLLPWNEQAVYELDSRMKAVKLRSGVQLDLGGIAKSWSVRKLSGWLRRKKGITRGLINAGGDAVVWDDIGEEQPSELRIQNPWNTLDSDAAIRLFNGGAATSSTLGRSWPTAAGECFHHIIDPRRMKPSTSDVVQCTITGSDVTACEVWSKVFCIAGFERGMQLLTRHAPTYRSYIYTSDRSFHQHPITLEDHVGRRRET